MTAQSQAADLAKRSKGIGLAVISAVSFSTLGLFAKLAYSQGMAPAQALAWRFSLAATVLWIVLASRRSLDRPWKEYRRVLLLGALGFAPQAGLYFMAVKYLDPGLASLLLYLYPSFVIGLSYLFLSRKPKAKQLVALLLSSLGCVLTLWTRGSYPLIGYVFGLAVAISYAAYLLVGERIIVGLDPIFITANLMSVSALIYWVVTLATGAFMLPTAPLALAGVAGLAFCGSILPIVTLFAAIRLIGSSDTSLVSTIEPLCTVALSALFFGERLSTLQMTGGFFVLSGVLILKLRIRRKAQPCES